MATTTNFGWETPDDTDLVKDGALAMRTLGNAIDTSFVDLKGGTTGQVLKKNSNTDLDFVWGTIAAGGKVLQVVASSTATQVANSTSTFADTGLSATITPSSASSKVLVLVSQQGAKSNQNNTNALKLQLLRTSTQIARYDSLGYTNSGVALYTSTSWAILDTPNTTSATTYKTQFANYFNGSSVAVNDEATSTIVLLEIGA
jgi:hypothetical protein